MDVILVRHDTQNVQNVALILIAVIDKKQFIESSQMTKPNLYIHIGTHKTGSSAIQTVLSNNQSALAHQGWINLLPNHQLFSQIMNLKGPPNPTLQQSLQNYFLSISSSSQQNNDTNYILSYEGFSGDLHKSYYNTEQVAQTLYESTQSFKVKIIIYLRRQDDFIESVYTQMIHEGASYSFQEFLTTLPDNAFDWLRFIKIFSNRFGDENIIVRTYDKTRLPVADSLLTDFFSCLNIQYTSLPNRNSSTSNCGLSRDALEIARLCYPIMNPDERWKLRLLLQNASARQPYEPHAFFSYEERQKTLDKYKGSNHEVAMQYCYPSLKQLFTDEKNLHSCYPGLDFNKALPSLMKNIIACLEMD